MSCFWQKTLYQVLSTHDKALKAVDEAFSLSSVTQSDGTVIVKVPRPNSEQQALLLVSKSRARKPALHQQVWDLHRQGYKAKTIVPVLCQENFRDLMVVGSIPTSAKTDSPKGKTSDITFPF
jgi:hypothetical protein